MAIIYPADAKGYTAIALGSYNATRTRGVFSAEDCFTVSAIGGRKISISDGLAWLKMGKYWGVSYLDTDAHEHELDVANGTLSRYVAVVLQLNKISGDGDTVLRYGELSAAPSMLLPVRNEQYDEIIVAQVLQSAGSIEVTAADITDCRLLEQYCGLMRDGVTRIPSAQIAAQATALLTQLQAELSGVLDGSEYMLKSAYGGSAPGVVATADEAINAMPKTGGTFTGAVAAAETATQTRRMLNTEVRSGSTTGELQNVVYFVDVV